MPEAQHNEKRTCWPVCMCCGLRGRPSRSEITYQLMGNGQVVIVCDDCWKKAKTNGVPWWDMSCHDSPKWVVEQWYAAAAEFGVVRRDEVDHLIHA